MKPGYLSHALAIAYNKDKGMQAYDFMSGDDDYKRSLSNKTDDMLWLVIQRKRFKFAIEAQLISLARRFRKKLNQQ